MVKILKNSSGEVYPEKKVPAVVGDNFIYHPQVYKTSLAPGAPGEACADGGVSCRGAGQSPANIFLNGRLVTFDEWKKNQKINKSKVLYPAYVPPIELRPYGEIIQKYGYIIGSNKQPTDDRCGMIIRKIQCKENPLHKPTYKHERCNDPGCPVCYVKFASRMADRVTERLQGFKTVWRNEKPYHLIFWGEKWTRDKSPYGDLRAAFGKAKTLLINMGAVSAVVWYHPYRIREDLKEPLRNYRRAHGLDGRVGFWKMAHDDVLMIGGIENYIVYGPHWHAIATGFLKNIKEYVKETGCGYKKKGYLDTEEKVHRVAHYISTHACREAGKSSVRYYGDLSYRMLAREMVETRIKDVLCSVCQSKLEEYECDETGVVSNKLKDNITEKIKYYLYWKKGQPKPEMSTHSQCLITRFSRD